MTDSDRTNDENQALVGRVLDDRYVVEEFIERGGYSSVYRGTDRKFNQTVAIKIGQSSREFMREARFAAEVKHDHIVRVTDFGCDNGIAYLVMEFLQGVDLEKLFKTQNRKLTTDQLRKLVDEIGGALAYAHSLHLIHRDLKPRNIIFQENIGSSGGDSNGSRFVLLDFGIASKLDAQGTQRNRTWDGAGTLEYMAPEMRGNEPKAIEQSDIYAFGVILYQMMTGRVPFPQADSSHLALAECLNAIGNASPPGFREIDPERVHPAAIEELVLQCLEKDPKNRPKSMTELRHRFREIYERKSPPTADTQKTSRNLSQTLRIVDLPKPTQENAETVTARKSILANRGYWGIGLTGFVVVIGAIAWVGAQTNRVPRLVPYLTLTDESGVAVDENVPVVLVGGKALTLTSSVNDLPNNAIVDFEIPIVPKIVKIDVSKGPIPGTSKNFTFSISDLSSAAPDLVSIVLRASIPSASSRFERSIKLKLERPKPWLPKDLSDLGFRESPDSWRCLVGDKVFAAILDRPIRGKSVRFRLVPAKTIGDRTLNTFYVMEKLVSNELFLEFSKANPAFELEDRKAGERRWEVERTANSPVTDIYALEAQLFAWWVAGTRYGTLPSATEWELLAGYWDFIDMLKLKFPIVHDIDSELLRNLRPIHASIPLLGAAAWIGSGPNLTQFQAPHGELLKERSPYGCQYERLSDGRRPTELTRTLIGDFLEPGDLKILFPNEMPALDDARFSKNYQVILRGSGESGDDISWLKGADERRVKSIKDLNDDAGVVALLPEEVGRTTFAGFRVVLLTDVDTE